MSSQAFLRDIVANPEDDASRLIFADWLDDTGDDIDRARAELIRLECQAEALEPGCAEREALLGRAALLRKRHATAWFGDLAALVETYETRRGFVAEVGVRASDFLEHAEQIFSLAPVRKVLLFDT